MKHEKGILVASIVTNALCCTAIGYLAYKLNDLTNELTTAKGEITTAKGEITKTKEDLTNEMTKQMKIGFKRFLNQEETNKDLNNKVKQNNYNNELNNKRLTKLDDLSSKVDLLFARDCSRE